MTYISLFTMLFYFKGDTTKSVILTMSYSSMPGNSGGPINISAAMQPSDHTSIASLKEAPRMISGALEGQKRETLTKK